MGVRSVHLDASGWNAHAPLYARSRKGGSKQLAHPPLGDRAPHRPWIGTKGVDEVACSLGHPSSGQHVHLGKTPFGTGCESVGMTRPRCGKGMQPAGQRQLLPKVVRG